MSTFLNRNPYRRAHRTSFFAGFVDSIAGGGGLIQLPALLIGLPKSGTAEVLGTNKLSAVFGTTTAAGW